MKVGVNQRTNFNIKGIAWLLLFIFCTLLLAEVSHSHRNLQSSEVSTSCSSDEAVFNEPQSFCEFCDYILHQSNRLLPVGYHFIAALAKVVRVTEFVQTQFVYTFNDLLLFSGNSPPLV
jgi:hypothetical protein